MNASLNSTDMNEKMDNGKDDKPVFLDSLTTASNSLITPDTTIAGSLMEITSCSKQNPTEKIQLSSTGISVNVLPHKTEVSAETNLHDNSKGEVTSAVSICSPCSVEKDQPKPLCALLPSSLEVYEVSRSFTSISRSQIKTPTINTGPGGDDLCAAILLACLFCHPLDCLLATMRGCNECIWSLCSSMCSCGPTTMQPLLDIIHDCDPCGCLDVHCCLCDCSICEVCLHATECLELAMEMSQMLYH